MGLWTEAWDAADYLLIMLGVLWAFVSGELFDGAVLSGLGVALLWSKGRM